MKTASGSQVRTLLGMLVALILLTAACGSSDDATTVGSEDTAVVDAETSDETDTTEDPVAEEPVAEEPVEDEPVEDEPVEDEPVVEEEPVDDDTAAQGGTDDADDDTTSPADEPAEDDAVDGEWVEAELEEISLTLSLFGVAEDELPETVDCITDDAAELGVFSLEAADVDVLGLLVWRCAPESMITQFEADMNQTDDLSDEQELCAFEVVTAEINALPLEEAVEVFDAAGDIPNEWIAVISSECDINEEDVRELVNS